MARRSTCAWTVALVAHLLALAVQAADSDGFRIRLSGTRHSQSVRRAVMGAHERLARPECQKLFTDFNDQAGRPLQERLDTLGVTGQEFLGFVGFYEGYGQPRCAHQRVMAFTQPGSLAVRVCPQMAGQDQDLVEMILLHEMLHSLGLGENPPSTYEITNQVRKRCGGRVRSLSARSATR